MSDTRLPLSQPVRWKSFAVSKTVSLTASHAIRVLPGFETEVAPPRQQRRSRVVHTAFGGDNKLAGWPVVALGDYRPTYVAEEVYRELTARIETRIAEFERVVAEDVAAFNKAAAGAKLGG